MLRRVIPASARQWLQCQYNFIRSRFLAEPYRSVLPYTMVGLPRLRVLQRLACVIDEEKTPGDVVECGVFNGGSGALLARQAATSPLDRHVWLLDSFQGMPTPDAKDGPWAQAWTGQCRGQIDRVREVLAKVHVPEDRVSLVAGWFEDTIPTLPDRPIALLHVDADWYESILLVFEQLYDRVSDGGFVVVDDYGYWDGCRLATDEFLARRGLAPNLVDVDGIAAYFQKGRCEPRLHNSG